MVSAGEFRNGVTFDMDGNVYQIIEFLKNSRSEVYMNNKETKDYVRKYAFNENTSF